MTEQPSLYRCETCRYYLCKEGRENTFDECRRRSPKVIFSLSHAQQYIIRAVGCTSHSAFNIPPEGAAPAHSPDAHVPGRGRMTPTDNYPTPSNGSLICTFSDCPIRYPALTMQPPCHWCGLSGKFCHEQRKDNNCPRGFQS